MKMILGSFGRKKLLTPTISDEIVGCQPNRPGIVRKFILARV